MAELNTDHVKFILEEFYIGTQDMNYTFIGNDTIPSAYNPYDYSLVYVREGELELVKNFLNTIRDNP